jgi:hypothetical protein
MVFRMKERSETEIEMARAEDEAQRAGLIIAFRAPRTLADAAEAAAAREGLTRSDIARRALMKDLAKEKTR